MSRDSKGTCWQTYINDYSLIDLETTGTNINSCEIIEISALKVRNGNVVEEFSTLINPLCHIPKEASAVNHITDDMVANAPILAQVIDKFLKFVENDVIVGYNNASFDINLIYDACIRLKGVPFSNNYIDLLYSARKCLPELNNHKLETVSKYYGLDTAGEHRALKDCYLTKECYDIIAKEFGNFAFERSSSGKTNNKKPATFSSETLALQELHDVVKSIIEDGNISVEELQFLAFWLDNHIDLRGNFPFDRIFDALYDVVEDGVVTDEELLQLKSIFEEFVDPVGCGCNYEQIESIEGKHICVTGEFEFGSRTEVQDYITSAGGIIDNGVKRATDYLVVGSLGSQNWKTGNYGGKILKAIEINEKGGNVLIVEERDFILNIQSILSMKETEQTEGNGIEDDGEISQMSLFDIMTSDSDKRWVSNIGTMLEELNKEYELPDGSLFVSENHQRKDPSIIISYTVAIFEPDFPASPGIRKGQTKNIVTINLKNLKDNPELVEMALGETVESSLRSYFPADAEMMERSDTDKKARIIRIRISRYSPNLLEYIKKLTIFNIKNYDTQAKSFGCCNLFVDCSDAKKCVHENKLYATACMYRRNLEAGKIFYGKNKNID